MGIPGDSIDAPRERTRSLDSIMLGVLSDTHIPHRLPSLPPEISALFAAKEVALILHAGDVDEPGVLDALSTVAPVIAVRGNLHLASRSRSSPHLPYAVSLDIMGQRVVLTHGHGRPHEWLWDKRRGFIKQAPTAATRDAFNEELIKRNQRRFPDADVLIFGHSHRRLCRRVGRTLFLNPGAIAHARDESASIVLLTLTAEGASAEFIEVPSEH